MAIRRAAASDLPALALLERQAFGEAAYPAFFFRQALDALGRSFLVADGPAGVSGYGLGSLEAGSTEAWVLSLAVAAEARGAGLGRALMVALNEELEGRGARAVLVHVAPDNLPARRLYRELGFEQVALVEGCFGPGRDRLVLRRSPRPTEAPSAEGEVKEGSRGGGARRRVGGSPSPGRQGRPRGRRSPR